MFALLLYKPFMTKLWIYFNVCTATIFPGLGVMIAYAAHHDRKKVIVGNYIVFAGLHNHSRDQNAIPVFCTQKKNTEHSILHV